MHAQEVEPQKPIATPARAIPLAPRKKTRQELPSSHNLSASHLAWFNRAGAFEGCSKSDCAQVVHCEKDKGGAQRAPMGDR